MKIFSFSLFVALGLGIIGYIFWQQELKFIGPTPIPENIKSIHQGDSVDISMFKIDSEKPLFIHFYNYHCPCSRFNIKDFEHLVMQYNDKVNFIAVIQSSDLDPSSAQEFKSKYDLGIPVIYDSEGKYADALGVYSTPQAVIIENSKVFYKGNYNKARFCTTTSTKFADIALYALVHNEPAPSFPDIAEIAYGCELPSNGNTSTRLFDFF